MKDLLDKLRKPIAAITISGALVTGVANHEGFRSEAYRPLPQDVYTIGFGTTKHEDGSSIKPGERITREQADLYLRNDLRLFVKQISNCIKVPITEYEFNSYVSLSYNIGSSAFCNSTLVKQLNQGNYDMACDEILKWNKFKGKELQGLTNRRKQEYKECKNQD